VAYVPSSEHLERYAELLVNFALGGGQGIAAGEVVRVIAPDNAKPLFAAACRAVWRAGGHVIQNLVAADDKHCHLSRDFFELASEEQLDRFLERYWRGLMDEVDHTMHIDSSTDPRSLASVAPERIMRRRASMMPLIGWQQAKEDAGRFSWTIALYGCEAMAAEAGLSIEDYWGQIIAACFLDDPDPVARWREVEDQIARHCAFLHSLAIERLHVEAEGTDLWLTLGEKRRWIGGGGRNIPSFEVFTSPDWRGTEGTVRFTEPVYIYGSLIEGVELEFRDGRIVGAHASRGEDLLRAMIATAGADRVGEFSLTDGRLSRITRFMADTLYDENTGGPNGNTHLAIGRSLRVCYDGDAQQLADEDWERLGFNESSVHTDIVATSERTVTAVLSDGSQRVIYAGGRFLDS
jgi:aminopeptidase